MCLGLVKGWSENESHSVLSNSLGSHGLYSPWNFPGQNTGEGSLSLLHRIFPTQGLNPGLPHYRRVLYQRSHKGSLALSKSSLNVCWVSGWIGGWMDKWMNEWMRHTTPFLVSSASCPSSLLKLSLPHVSPCLATFRFSPFSTIPSLK